MKLRRPSRRRVLALLTVVSLMFAAAAFVVVQRQVGEVTGQADAAADATNAAAESLPAMLGYRHASMAADLDAATDLMTKRFAAKYSELAPQLTSVAEQRQIDVVAQVRKIAPLECGQECSSTSVRVLAFVDQNRTIAGEPGSPAALAVVVTMKKVSGDWLIDDVVSG